MSIVSPSLRGATLLACVVALSAADERSTVADRSLKLSRDSIWTFVTRVPLEFPTFHPQGMVKIGDEIFVSSVEVTRTTTRFATPANGYDRDAGAGIGHLFKLNLKGQLLADLILAAGDVYHPGGIDYDGRSIWVPLAEYRPNSHSIIYKVDPKAMTAVEVFRYPDSIGAIAYNTDERTLHGVNWGSRQFYRWTLDASGRVTNAATPRETLAVPNASHYVDYQDCKYVGSRRMLCTGLAELRQTPSAPSFRLGGIDLVSLVDNRPIHQSPLLLWTADGTVMTRNPVWIEPSAAGLRGYFLPEDDRSTLYVYDVNAR